MCRCGDQQGESNSSASNLPGEQQCVALKDLIHFIGDVHQPLHAVANIGGQKVGFHGKPTTLHAVWDKE